jgi:hypothetical protein
MRIESWMQATYMAGVAACNSARSCAKPTRAKTNRRIGTTRRASGLSCQAKEKLNAGCQ